MGAVAVLSRIAQGLWYLLRWCLIHVG